MNGFIGCFMHNFTRKKALWLRDIRMSLCTIKIAFFLGKKTEGLFQSCFFLNCTFFESKDFLKYS